MTELQELMFAREALETAQRQAFVTNEIPEDRSAATTAILVQAIILATPELSDSGRQRLFMKESEQ